MSVTSRGQFSGPGSIPRDYGLLQAPSTTLKPCPSESESEDEQAELEDARRAVDRYTRSGLVYDPHIVPRDVCTRRSGILSGRRTSTASVASGHLAPLHDAGSTASSSASRMSSVERQHSYAFAGRTRPMAMPQPQRNSHQSLAASHSPGGLSTSRRYREMVLGGEPNPPPIEQVQQRYLEQHYAAPGDWLVQRHTRRSSSQSRLGGATRHAERWSHTSSELIPRYADVAQVRDQVRRRSHVADTERIEASNEQTPLVVSGRSSSYDAVPSNVSGAPGKPAPGTMLEESIASDDTMFKELPGPGASAEEAKTLAWYTLPILGTHLLELSLSVVTVFAIGHLGTTELAAASLATMTANVTGFSIISGWVSALDSLLPAAYSSPHPYAVGIWTQRMCILIFFLTIPIIVAWWNTEALLLALRQDPEVSALSAWYLQVLSLAVPAFGAFEIIRRYLQALGLFHAPTIAVGVASAFNVPAQILLVYGPDKVRLGFLGAPVASVLSYYLMLIFGLFQCWLAPRDAWHGLSRKALGIKGLVEVWNLGLSSTIAVAAEWWAWEIANLMSSMLGTSALAAQSVLLVTCSLTYQLPQSVSVAAAVRIGNLLGANQPFWARLSTRTAMLGALVCGLLNSSAMILFRKQWGWLFSSDPELVKMIATIMPYVGAFQIADGICGVGAGILRGSGRQSKGAVINLFAYYIVGLPIGLALMTTFSWGLQGIWLGLSIGLLVGAIGFLALIFRTDWASEAEKVLSRMEEDAVPEAQAEAQAEATLEEEVASLADEEAYQDGHGH